MARTSTRGLEHLSPAHLKPPRTHFLPVSLSASESSAAFLPESPPHEHPASPRVLQRERQRKVLNAVRTGPAPKAHQPRLLLPPRPARSPAPWNDTPLSPLTRRDSGPFGVYHRGRPGAGLGAAGRRVSVGGQ